MIESASVRNHCAPFISLSIVDAAATMHVGGWTMESLLLSYLFVELKNLGKNYFCINFVKLTIEPVTV